MAVRREGREREWGRMEGQSGQSCPGTCKCAGCRYGPGAVKSPLGDPSWQLYGLVLHFLSFCPSPYN